MKIIGTMIARNEAWVIPASIPAALAWCDALIVTVHACIDGTLDAALRLADLYPGRLFYQVEPDPAWREADYRGRLLESARAMGATHVALIDADEILTGPGTAAIRQAAVGMEPGGVLWVPWIHCWRSTARYRSDGGVFGVARVPVVFRDDPSLHYSPDADGYQTHKRVPRGARRQEAWARDDGMGVLHLQHAHWPRLLWKQRWYVLLELEKWGCVRANYAGTVCEDGLETRAIPDEWWPVDRGLIDLEAQPWQRAECERLLAGRDPVTVCGF